MFAEWLSVASAALVVLMLSSFYVSWRAGRLDGLHTRLETASAALDAALARRQSAVLELASSPLLEPASRLLLADAVSAARRAATESRREQAELAESALSRALRAVVAESGPLLRGGDGSGPAIESGDELLAQVEAAARRVLIARSFYNDAVATIRRARSRRLVRLLRLAGRAPMPEFFEMDDEPPRAHPLP